MPKCPHCQSDLSQALPVETVEEDHRFDAMESIWHDWKVVQAFCYRCMKMVEISRKYLGSRDKPGKPEGPVRP